ALEEFDARQKGGTVTVSALNKQRLDRTLEFIEVNLDHDIGLREIGEAADVGVYNLSRHFPKVMGEPPHVYLARRRLERVKELLANTDKPMSEIAHLCGFSSQSYLSTVFKRSIGVTLSRYRVEARC
ncbi:MAG: AraC family transcriptional regulator, partial [Exilibacterium sp.]